MHLKDSYTCKQIDTSKVYKCNIKFIKSRGGKSEISPRSTGHVSQPVTYQPKCDKLVIQTSTHPALEVHNSPARKAYTPRHTGVMMNSRKLFQDVIGQGQQGGKVHRQLTKAIQTRYGQPSSKVAGLCFEIGNGSITNAIIQDKWHWANWIISINIVKFMVIN